MSNLTKAIGFSESSWFILAGFDDHSSASILPAVIFLALPRHAIYLAEQGTISGLANKEQVCETPEKNVTHDMRDDSMEPVSVPRFVACRKY